MLMSVFIHSTATANRDDRAFALRSNGAHEVDHRSGYNNEKYKICPSAVPIIIADLLSSSVNTSTLTPSTRLLNPSQLLQILTTLFLIRFSLTRVYRIQTRKVVSCSTQPSLMQSLSSRTPHHSRQFPSLSLQRIMSGPCS